MKRVVPSLKRAGLRVRKFFHAFPKRRRPLPVTDNDNIEAAPLQPTSPEETKATPNVHTLECTHPDAAPCKDLPIELWFTIVHYALEPRYNDFLPQDIQFFYTYLLVHPLYCPYRTEPKHTRASLRLVCRSLRSIVDEISLKDQNFAWIWNYDPWVPQTELYTRLDTTIGYLDDLLEIEQPYPHEVRILSIRVEYGNGAVLDPVLSSLLTIPWTLKVLHLWFPRTNTESHRIPEKFPISILSGLLSLETLSIAAPNALLLSGTLFMPQVLTLFITCSLHSNSDISEWSFPNLKNLAIDTRGWPIDNLFYLCEEERPRNIRADISVSLGKLLRRHGKTIQSLRMIPFMPTALCPRSRWASLPHLNTLATDLVKYRPTEYSPVVHITHISTHPYTRNQLSKALLETVRSVPSLRTLAITQDPQMPGAVAQVKKSKDQYNALSELEEVCRTREIRIIGMLGSDVCCVSKAYCDLILPFTF